MPGGGGGLLSTSREAGGRPFRLLFVCTGNTCRSPIAEVLARREQERRGWEWMEVVSAGTFAPRDEPASELAEIVARRSGLDLTSHRTRPLVPDLVESAELVVGMGPSHVEIARQLCPRADPVLITRFLSVGHPARELAVPDPAGGSLHEYERTFELLAAAVQGLFGHLEERFGVP